MADFLLILPIFLFSVVAHEFGHAWAAYQQGDNTAFRQGRMTFNPIPHIDPFMSILVPAGLWLLSSGAFTFGAAKPVPVNPANFRNYRRGDIIVSSAGILMNALLALGCAAVFVAIGLLGQALPSATWLATVQRVMGIGISLNVLLAVFNLVPLPPLDGSHLFYHLLPPWLGARYRAFGRYGFAVLMLALMILPAARTVALWPVVRITEAAHSALGPWSLERAP